MKQLRRLRRWLRELFHMKPATCEPNVIVGYEGGRSEVLQWMCGDKVCRCGGTWERRSDAADSSTDSIQS